MVFTANWISMMVELFFIRGLLYSLWVSLITGVEYGRWNGKVLLSKLVLLCKMYLTHGKAGGMSLQLVWPNLTARTMQLNAWVADNFMNIEMPFLPLIL